MSSSFEERFIVPLETACREARQRVDSPDGESVGSTYGGLFIVQRCEETEGEPRFFVWNDDDIEAVPDDIDVVAHVARDGVCPFGRARQFLNVDGTVCREYFER